MVKAQNSRVDRFQKTLMEYGFTVIVRKTRGDDIDAACGQLAGGCHRPNQTYSNEA